jgi:hypothetical protein
MNQVLEILSHVPSREQILALQDAVKGMQQYEPETTHYFADGMYCRSVFRVAGAIVVGKVHKKEHFFILVSGDMTVWTESGMKRVQAPFIWVSKPGTKRVTLAHTDSTAVTVHKVSSTDIAEIEDELIEPEAGTMYGPGNTLLPLALENGT